MNSQFKSAFNAIYNARIKCPSCKEKIYAHAKKCPYCHFDLTSDEVIKGRMWQSKARKILMLYSVLVIILMLINKINVGICLLTGLVIYGFGCFIVLKMQSFINSIK